MSGACAGIGKVGADRGRCDRTRAPPLQGLYLPVHVSCAVCMERTVWGPSGVTRLTVNICAGATRGAATREVASLETPENAKVEEARKYSMTAIEERDGMTRWTGGFVVITR